MPPSHRPFVDTGDASALVARARAGDVQAFEGLYAQNVNRIFALVLRMTGDRARARELTHDVFVRAWEKLDGFRGEAAFSTWLHRLAVNVVLERERSERRRRAHEIGASDVGDGDEEWEHGAATLRMVRHDDGLRLDLEAGIARLPPNARLVFVLHAIEGYAHDEIARQMDIAEGTVRAHLHRARRLLMEFLS